MAQDALLKIAAQMRQIPGSDRRPRNRLMVAWRLAVEAFKHPPLSSVDFTGLRAGLSLDHDDYFGQRFESLAFKVLPSGQVTQFAMPTGYRSTKADAAILGIADWLDGVATSGRKKRVGSMGATLTKADVDAVARVVRTAGNQSSSRVILERLTMQRQRAFLALRVLEKQGKYKGFPRKATPEVSRRVEQFLQSSVP